MLPLLVVILSLTGLALVAYFVRAAIAAEQLELRAEPLLLGAVTNFFDTLGIGSFAPSMAWIRFRKLLSDRRLPMTMLAGYTPPSVLQAVIFLILLGVHVDPLLLFGSAVALVAGALVGAPVAVRVPVRAIRIVVAIALLTAATFYAFANLGLMPVGGSANSLPLALTLVTFAANFGFGVLLNFGVGNYAPTLAMLSLFGIDPRLAFPVMAFGAASAGSAASFRLVRLASLDLRFVLSLIAGAIPAVLVAAFLVKEMPVATLRWMVVVVVVYAALTLLYEAYRNREEAPDERLAEALAD